MYKQQVEPHAKVLPAHRRVRAAAPLRPRNVRRRRRQVPHAPMCNRLRVKHNRPRAKRSRCRVVRIQAHVRAVCRRDAAAVHRRREHVRRAVYRRAAAVVAVYRRVAAAAVAATRVAKKTDILCIIKKSNKP